MENTDDNPQFLREKAERALRLASMTGDESARDALVLYGQELLARADMMECEDNPRKHGID